MSPDLNNTKEKKKGFLSTIFSGLRKMPSRYTLRLISPQVCHAERFLPWGVDFGSTAVRLIQIGFFEKTPQIVNLIIEELPQELKENPLERKRSLPQIFKRIVQEHRIKGEVATSIPSSTVQIKKIKLPPMPKKEIEAAVKWEMKQSSTIGLEELAFDYYLLNGAEMSSTNEIELIIISCPKREVLEQLAIIEAANLVPLAVEMDCQVAVCSLVRNQQIKKAEVILFLDFGYCSCSVSIVVNNRIIFKRELAINGDSLTQAISKHCHLSYEGAERLKQNLGLMETTGRTVDTGEPEQQMAIMVNEALWLHLENLIQEIDYTSKYFVHQLSAGSIDKFDRIILSGGSARLHRFPFYLSSYLSVPVEIADPLKDITLSPEISSKFKDLSSLSPELSVAMGLATRGLD